jgi:hypothetical protein
MQVTPVRATAEPHVRADEHAAAVERLVQPAVAAAAPTKVHASSGAEGGVAHERGRPRDDSHDLRARDMEVRTEHALQEPDGSLDLLPSYEFALGPDGLPYAVEQGIAPFEPPEEPPVEGVEAREEVDEEPEPTTDVVARERAPIDETPVSDDDEDTPSPERREEPIARAYGRSDEPVVAPRVETVA